MIPFLDLGKRHAAMADRIEEAALRVLRGGHYVLGPEVDAFETEYAAQLGGGFCVGVASGTDAITLALLGLGIGPEDEVLTVANTCMPTVSGIRSTGASVRLVDCDRTTRTVEAEAVEQRLTPRTKAVVAVHLYGHPADTETLAQLCHRRGVRLVEDCAQAHGARLRGRPVGTFGDAAAFSFYPTKNLGAYGDGGLVFTESEEVAARVRLLRMYGYQPRDHSVIEGRNSRLDELQAALLRVQLPVLPAWVERRRAIARLYQSGLSSCSGVQLPVEREGAESSYHLYVIAVERRDAVRERLRALGVGTAVHYPVPIHRHPVYARVAMGEFPQADWLCERVLSLPCHPDLSDTDVTEVVRAVGRAVS